MISTYTCLLALSCFFFTNTPPTEIYPLSLHGRSSDLHQPGGQRGQVHRPGLDLGARDLARRTAAGRGGGHGTRHSRRDRKSTRLNSSHGYISYAVFCLKKKKQTPNPHEPRQSN